MPKRERNASLFKLHHCLPAARGHHSAILEELELVSLVFQPDAFYPFSSPPQLCPFENSIWFGRRLSSAAWLRTFLTSSARRSTGLGTPLSWTGGVHSAGFACSPSGCFTMSSSGRCSNCCPRSARATSRTKLEISSSGGLPASWRSWAQSCWESLTTWCGIRSPTPTPGRGITSSGCEGLVRVPFWARSLADVRRAAIRQHDRWSARARSLGIGLVSATGRQRPSDAEVAAQVSLHACRRNVRCGGCGGLLRAVLIIGAPKSASDFDKFLLVFRPDRPGGGVLAGSALLRAGIVTTRSGSSRKPAPIGLTLCLWSASS